MYLRQYYQQSHINKVSECKAAPYGIASVAPLPHNCIAYIYIYIGAVLCD